jgi:tRNA(Ile2) C34 agmatinyltransferase TiaS
MVTIEDARSAASAAEVTLVPVTGERGCIGAIAAVGMHSDPDAAVVLPGAGA